MFTIDRFILRANAAFIGIAGSLGILFDFRGIYFGAGPQGRLLADAPNAGIGFVEAHGLAVILAVLLWRAAPSRSWHVTALAIELLLGGANLFFWQMFIDTDALAIGYVSTSLHGVFAALQGLAAVRATATLAPGLELARSPRVDARPIAERREHARHAGGTAGAKR